MLKKKPVVGLGFPLSSNPMCWNDFAFSVMDMIQYSLQEGIVGEFKSMRITSSDIAGNRNKLFQWAKDQHCDYHFQIDNDMVVQKDCIERLIALQKAMPDCLLTGHAPVGGGAHYPAAWMEDTDGKGVILWDLPEQPFECMFVGGFGLWMPKSLLWSKDLPRDPFDVQTGDPAEDFSFCRAVRAAGHKIICDPSIEFGHMRPQTLTKRNWEAVKGQFDESRYYHFHRG